MKRKSLLFSVCLFGLLLFSANASDAAVYYTTNGCRCDCPPQHSSFTVYSPYGSFSITDEYYFGGVTYRVPPRRISRPAPPPPPPKGHKPAKPGNPPPPPPKRK